MSECPHCGAEVPPGARACPECGSDDQTGWSEAAKTDGLDLPDESFDYEEFVSREFGGNQPGRRGREWFWWLVAIVVLAAIAFWLLRIK